MKGSSLIGSNTLLSTPFNHCLMSRLVPAALKRQYKTTLGSPQFQGSFRCSRHLICAFTTLCLCQRCQGIPKESTSHQITSQQLLYKMFVVFNNSESQIWSSTLNHLSLILCRPGKGGKSSLLAIKNPCFFKTSDNLGSPQ